MIDPRLEEVLRQRRRYKKRIDRRRRLVRTVMLCPFVLVALERLVTFFGTEPEARYTVGMLSFLVALAFSFFTAGEVMLEIERWIEISTPFYWIAGAACVLLPFPFPGDRVPLTVLALSCLLAALLNLWFKRLYEENQTLKRMKGYPHFDPRFISEEELREEKPAPPKPPEGLTPEEELVWERDRGL